MAIMFSTELKKWGFNCKDGRKDAEKTAEKMV